MNIVHKPAEPTEATDGMNEDMNGLYTTLAHSIVDTYPDGAGDTPCQDGAGNQLALFNYADGCGMLIVKKGVSTLSLGGGITPAMLTAMLDRESRVVLLVDRGRGGALILANAGIDDLSGVPARVQFIDDEKQVRIFDLAAWLRNQQAALQAADWRDPIAFDGAGVELTGSVAQDGGYEAMVYALYGMEVSDERDPDTHAEYEIFYGGIAA